MPRRSVFIALMVAMLAAAAPAGEIKTREWPTEFIPLEVAAVPVVMDIGFWVEIVKQDIKIKLIQVSIHKYEGCVNLQVRTNFNLTLSSEITPTGVIGGKYSSWIEGPDINTPGGTAKLCARLIDADLMGKPGGTKDVHVATVVVKVVPRV